MADRVQHLRHQAAGEEDAVPCAEREHEVTCDRTEDRAEHIDRAAAARIAGGGTRGDVGRTHRPGIDAGDLAERAMDVDQAGAADQPLVRHPSKLRRQVFQDADFLGRARREAHVAALGFQRMVLAVADHQAADAEAGARADHRIGAGAVCILRHGPRHAADGAVVPGLQQRDRHRLGREIVDQLDVVEAELLPGARTRDHPRMIGDARLVAVDAAGDGEHRAPDRGAVTVPGGVEIVLRGFGQRRKIRDREPVHGVEPQRRGAAGVGQRETGVRAADVGEQGQRPRRAHDLRPLCVVSVRGRKGCASTGPQLPAG